MIRKIRTNKRNMKNINYKTKKINKQRKRKSIKKGGVIPFISHVDNPFTEYKLTDDDKNKPFCDFFIYSSHNTEMEGRQIKGVVNDIYINCGFLQNNSPLQKGGCLELDIQVDKNKNKSEGNEPQYKIGHGQHSDTFLDIIPVFSNIATYDSDLPLIVNIDTTGIKGFDYDIFMGYLNESNLFAKLNKTSIIADTNIRDIDNSTNVIIRWDYGEKKKQMSPTSTRNVSRATSPSPSPPNSPVITPPSSPVSFNFPSRSQSPVSGVLDLHTNLNENEQFKIITMEKKKISKSFKHNSSIDSIFEYRHDSYSDNSQHLFKKNNIMRIYPNTFKSVTKKKTTYYWGDLLLAGCNMISVNIQNYDLDNLAYQSFFLPSHYIPIPSDLKESIKKSENFITHKENMLSKSNYVIEFIDKKENYEIKNYFYKNNTECHYFEDDLSVLNLFIIEKKDTNNTKYTGIINLNKNTNINNINVKLYNLKNTDYLVINDDCTIKKNEAINVISETINLEIIKKITRQGAERRPLTTKGTVRRTRNTIRNTTRTGTRNTIRNTTSTRTTRRNTLKPYESEV
jgi:hypothetical protein